MLEQIIQQDFIIHAITKRYEEGHLEKDIFEKDLRRRISELVRMNDPNNIIKRKKELGWTGGATND